MAGSLMLINPRKRRKSRKHPVVARRRRRHSVAAAPKRRRVHTRRHNPIGLSRVHHARRHRRARRHNPIAGLGNIGTLVMNGLKGAAGSVVVNAITNFLPATFRTGNVLYVARAGLAIILGTVGSKVVGRHARPMAEGALAVNFADLINSFGGGMIPGSHLHGMGAMPGAELSAIIEGNRLGATEYVPMDERYQTGSSGVIGDAYDYTGR